MENSCWPESLPSNRTRAIQELIQGQHLTSKLRQMLRRPEKIESDLDSVDDVVGQILGMFDNTLSVFTSTSCNEVPQIPAGDEIRSPSSWDDQKSEVNYEEINSKTVAPLKVKRGCYKRRKDSWTSIKITSSLIDDGYAWRKYGQKVILNAKHQRNYYRCTHKTENGCRATKQVQMTEDEPPQYKTTYNGHHTCDNFLRAPVIILDSQDDKDNTLVFSFETKGLNKNKQLESCFPLTKTDPKNDKDNSLVLSFETKGHNRNQQVDSYLSPTKHKEGFPSLDFVHNQASSSDHYLPWALTSQVPSELMSMMSSGLDQDDMISSEVYSSTCRTDGYEIENILGSNVFCDFPFEFCS